MTEKKRWALPGRLGNGGVKAKDTVPLKDFARAKYLLVTEGCVVAALEASLLSPCAAR